LGKESFKPRVLLNVIVVGPPLFKNPSTTRYLGLCADAGGLYGSLQHIIMIIVIKKTILDILKIFIALASISFESASN
jgi:hypothetical protein